MSEKLKFNGIDGSDYEVSGRVGFPIARTGLPKGATPLFASSGNKANAEAAATLTAVAGQELWMQGFDVRGAGATTGLPVIVTVTGLYGVATASFIYVFSAGVLVPTQPLLFSPSEPIKGANGSNIVVTCPAGGSGNTHTAVNVWGYLL